MQLPNLNTARLVLRPYVIQDAPTVQSMLEDRRIAAMCASIPWPYPPGAAEEWLGTHEVHHDQLTGVIFAVTRRQDDVLLGTVSLLDVHAADHRAEVGYWIAAEHWNQGYCTEALQALMAFARNTLGITRITGRCLAHNRASARVLEKCGLLQEGVLHAHARSEGKYHDVLAFGVCWPERMHSADG